MERPKEARGEFLTPLALFAPFHAVALHELPKTPHVLNGPVRLWIGEWLQIGEWRLPAFGRTNFRQPLRGRSAHDGAFGVLRSVPAALFQEQDSRQGRARWTRRAKLAEPVALAQTDGLAALAHASQPITGFPRIAYRSLRLPL
jgi:hypothetical protein